MSEIAVRNAPLAQLRSALSDESLAQIEAALPPEVSPTQFLNVANRALIENPALLQADRPSLFTAVSKCARSGLEPDGQQAALVIYKTKVKTDDGDRWIQKVQFMPMILGLRKIAAEYGWTIDTQVVRTEDEFSFELGMEPKVVHRTPKLGTDRGDLVGAYAICRHRGHDPVVVVLDAQDVAKIKAASKTSGFGPWKDWEAEMWAKSAGRKAFKLLPLGEKEAERIRRLLAETEIADPAAALYGPRPELAAVTASDAQAAGGDGGPQAASPSAAPEGPAAPGFDYSSLAGDEGEASNDGMPAPSASGDSVCAPSPAPAETVAPDSLPGGFGGKTLTEIAASERGRDVLKMVLLNAPAGDEFRAAVEAFAQTSAPAVWKAYCDAKFGSES